MAREAIGYHFGRVDRRLAHGDGRVVITGQTLTVKGTIVPTQHGLHACPRVYDGLFYAGEPVLARVRLSGTIVACPYAPDNMAASERTELVCRNATPLLRLFARRCALDVVHLWKAPRVVRTWLASGAERLREAAGDAARTYDAVHAGGEDYPDPAVSAAHAAIYAAYVATYPHNLTASTAMAIGAAAYALSDTASVDTHGSPATFEQKDRLQRWADHFLDRGDLPQIGAP